MDGSLATMKALFNMTRMCGLGVGLWCGTYIDRKVKEVGNWILPLTWQRSSEAYNNYEH